MTIKCMKLNYQVIIKTRSNCMFRYMTGAIYFRIQAERGWLLKIDWEWRTMFRMGPVHARDNGPGVSGTEPERTARHRTYYMPESLSIRPNRNRVSPFPTGYTQGIIAYLAGRQGVRVPVHPSEMPGGLQVESNRNSCTTYLWPP